MIQLGDIGLQGVQSGSGRDLLCIQREGRTCVSQTDADVVNKDDLKVFVQGKPELRTLWWRSYFSVRSGAPR